MADASRSLTQRVRLALAWSARAAQPGTPAKLHALLCQEDVLACLVLLHKLKVSATVQGNVRCSFAKKFLEPYFADTWRRCPAVTPVTEALATEVLPGEPESQGEGVWGRHHWSTAKAIATALRTALCGEPLARAVSPAQAAHQELLAAAVLITSGYMTDAILHWWSRLPQGLQSEVLLPGYLVTTLTLCLQSISAALYPLQCGQRQHVALPALLYVADCSLSATAPVPKGLCTSPGPGKRTASGNQQASLPSSDAVAPVDLRGLLVAALATCHRASRLHSELTPRQHYHPGLSLLGQLTWTAGSTLGILHTHLPRPITDPAPAFRLPMQQAASSSSSSGAPGSSGPSRPQQQLHYRQGRVWSPDAYSLGPAPAALAGAEGVARTFDMLVADLDHVEGGDVLGCLQVLMQLNTLAQAMRREAADPMFKQRMEDMHTLRSWVVTCGAMCKAAHYPFVALSDLGAQLKEQEERGVVTGVLHNPEVVVSMPLLCATALQLTHAVLGCVRRIDADTVLTRCKASRTLWFADEAVEASRQALRLYTELLALARLLCTARTTTTTTRPSRWAGATGATSVTSLVPPDFARHCVAVATCSPNLPAIWGLLKASIELMTDMEQTHGAACLVSWMPEESNQDFIKKAVYVLERLGTDCVQILAAAGGDLAGWLGGVAPQQGSGLDSSQLFYRLCCLYGLPARKVQVGDFVLQTCVDNLAQVHSRVLPLLAMAYQVAPKQQRVQQGPQQQQPLQPTSGRRVTEQGSTSAAQSQARTQTSTPSCSVDRGARASAPQPEHGAQPSNGLYHTLVDALLHSPHALGGMLLLDTIALHGGGTNGLVLGLLQEVLQLPEDQPSLVERGSKGMAILLDPVGEGKAAPRNLPAQQEPLVHLIDDHQMGQLLRAWTARESQAAEEELAVRLQGYVTAARERCRQAVSGIAQGVF